MEDNKKNQCNCNAASGGIYGLAFIGALVYYIQQSHTFLEGLVGFLKAIIWPATLVYKLLEVLLK